MTNPIIMEDYLNFTLSLLTASDPTDPSTRRWKEGIDTSWCATTAPLNNTGLAIKPTPPQVCVDRTLWQDTDVALINTMLGYGTPQQQQAVQSVAKNAVATTKENAGHPGYAYFQLVEYDPVTSTPIGSPSKNCYLEVLNGKQPSFVQTKTRTDCATSNTEQKCESDTNCSWVSNKCTDKLYQCSVDIPSVETYTSPIPCNTCSTIKDNATCVGTQIDRGGQNICKWSDGKCIPIGGCSCQPTSDSKSGTKLSECIKSCSYPLAPANNYVRGLTATCTATLDPSGKTIIPGIIINLYPVRPVQGGIPDTLFFISEYGYKYYRIQPSIDQYGMAIQLSGKCYSAAQGGWQPFNAPKISSGCLGSNIYTLQYTVTQSYQLKPSKSCSRPKSCPTCYGVGSELPSDPSCTYGNAPFCYQPTINKCTNFYSNNYFIPFFYFMMNSPKWLNKCCNFNPQTDFEVDDDLKYFCSVRGDKLTLPGGLQIPSYTLDPNSNSSTPLCDLRMSQLCDSNNPNMANNIGIDECSCLQRTNTTVMDQPLYQYLSDTLNIPPTCLSGACDPSVSYVPADLRKQICPNICSSVLQVDSNGMANVEIDGVNMSVWCDQTTGTVALSSESPLLASESTSNKSGNNNKWVIYLLVILIVVLGVLIIFYSL